jgi:hypothetical protein
VIATMRRTAWILGLVLAALAAGACGDDDDDAEVVQGSGYEYELPGGWTDESSQDNSELGVAGFEPDTIALDEPDDGFATNVNVVLEPRLPAGVTPQAYFDASRRVLRDPGVLPAEARRAVEQLQPRDLSRQQQVDLDGEQAYGLDYTGNQSGRVLRFRAVSTVREGTGYAVTYAALRNRFDEGLDDFERLLDTWRWQ